MSRNEVSAQLDSELLEPEAQDQARLKQVEIFSVQENVQHYNSQVKMLQYAVVKDTGAPLFEEILKELRSFSQS